jgi:hypothetical protein
MVARPQSGNGGIGPIVRRGKRGLTPPTDLNNQVVLGASFLGTVHCRKLGPHGLRAMVTWGALPPKRWTQFAGSDTNRL